MKKEIEIILKRLPYSKPSIKKEEGMRFPEQIRVKMLGGNS